MSDKRSDKPVIPAGANKPTGDLDRRDFLRMVGIAGAASGLGLPLAASPANRDVYSLAASPVSPAADPEQGQQAMSEITLKVNGTTHALRLDSRTTLLDALREHLQLTGTKKGCDHGQCGACTVHVNGRRVNACLSFAAMHVGDEITTLEGLGNAEHLHPMQQSFLEHDAYQCGYCTPGQIMSATALMTEPCGPADADVREAMSGNICRCGAYTNILAAIRKARSA